MLSDGTHPHLNKCLISHFYSNLPVIKLYLFLFYFHAVVLFYVRMIIDCMHSHALIHSNPITGMLESSAKISNLPQCRYISRYMVYSNIKCITLISSKSHYNRPCGNGCVLSAKIYSYCRCIVQKKIIHVPKKQ